MRKMRVTVITRTLPLMNPNGDSLPEPIGSVMHNSNRNSFLVVVIENGDLH